MIRTLVLCFLAQALTAWAADRKPNVVYILADDLGYGELGCYDAKEIPTPNIDSIATNGTKFTSGYVSCPVCSPTRAGFLTGRYQQRFGLEMNPPPKTPKGFGLPLTEKTIGDRLKALGYATGWIGKSHEGMEPEFHPMKRGFDEFFGFLGGAHPYLGEKGEKENPLLRGTEPAPEENYLTNAFSREAVSFIDRHKDEPFLLYVAFNGVHTPLQAPKDLMAKFKSERDPKRRTFSAMLAALDDGVGAILTKLRELKLEENTLIVFFSDNGGPTQQTSCRNTPLRGYKGQTLEGGVRVPFLMQWKGRVPAGKTFEPPVIALDLLPTAIAAAEGEVGEDWKLDGVNLLPYVLGEKVGFPHESLFWRFGNQAAIREGDWKLVRYAIGRNGRQAGEWELYDVTNDIGELRNMATEEPDRLKRMEEAWNTWNASLATAKVVSRRAPRPHVRAKARKNVPVEKADSTPTPSKPSENAEPEVNQVPAGSPKPPQ